jgi:peptide alpha-N-acetyltransferase
VSLSLSQSLLGLFPRYHKTPNEIETLALKALTLHSSLPFPATASSASKQEEADALARTAIKKDITSHITWHVLGILAKNKKDYGEASRAFAMARKQDKVGSVFKV